MLADINLLPKKERTSHAFLIAAAILAVLLILACSWMYWEIHSVKAEQETVRAQVEAVQKQRIKAEEAINAGGSGNAAVLLQQGVEWAEANRLPTVFFLEHVTGLLPERGFLMNVDYEEQTRTVNLIVQFDTDRETAYFLNRLKQSSYINKAELIALAAEKLEEEKTESGLPRYLAEYKLTLNVDEIQRAAYEEGTP